MLQIAGRAVKRAARRASSRALCPLSTAAFPSTPRATSHPPKYKPPPTLQREDVLQLLHSISSTKEVNFWLRHYSGEHETAVAVVKVDSEILCNPDEPRDDSELMR